MVSSVNEFCRFFGLCVSRRAAGQLETFFVFKLTLRSRQRLPSLDQTASIAYEKVYYFRTRLRDVLCRPRAVPDAADKKHWYFLGNTCVRGQKERVARVSVRFMDLLYVNHLSSAISELLFGTFCSTEQRSSLRPWPAKYKQNQGKPYKRLTLAPFWSTSERARIPSRSAQLPTVPIGHL